MNPELKFILTHLPIAVAYRDQASNEMWFNQEWQNQFGTEWNAIVDDLQTVALPNGNSLRFVQDLTLQKKLEQAARLSSLGEMAARVAHEINNPLAIIKATIQVLGSEAEQNNVSTEEVLRVTKTITNSTNRITKIISAIRSLSRDGEKDPIVSASLKVALENSLELCRAKFKSSGVRLQVELPESDPCVECRPVQVEQVLLNLLNNALHAVGPSQEKWVKVDMVESKTEVTICVSDSGPHIPAEIRKKIMTPFFTTKKQGEGLGLGLSLAKNMMEAVGGSLHLNDFSAETQFVMKLKKTSGEL